MTQRGTLKPSETNYLEPYCADCMAKIQSRGVGTIFAYFDSRLRAWVCPDCWQARKTRKGEDNNSRSSSIDYNAPQEQ